MQNNSSQSILHMLLRQSSPLLVAALLATATHGACVVLLVSGISSAVADIPAGGRGQLDSVKFFALVLLLALSQLMGSLLFVRITRQAHESARRFVCAKISASSLRSVETAGEASIQAALIEHCPNIVRPLILLPVMVASAVTVLGCFGYMATLSPKAFGAMTVALGTGVLIFRLANHRGMRHFNNATTEQTATFSHFYALSRGAKELKLNRQRAARFEQAVLGPSIAKVATERARGMAFYVSQTSATTLLIFGLVWFVLYVLLAGTPDRLTVATGFALCVAYLIGPMEALLVNAPQLAVAIAAAKRVDSLIGSMVDDDLPDSEVPSPVLRTIALRSVQHRYASFAGDAAFAVGPIDLELRAGKITFLVGGNGSGKSTLAKMVAGLYPLDAGALLINETICAQGCQRNLVAAVFAEFHLFDPWLGSAPKDESRKANELLRELQLSHKVQVSNGTFSTTSLSTGQRKRLALVTALLEDKSLFIFDEWAADQDVAFRDFFYRDVLLKLKRANKAVLVISHDRQYYDVADEVVEIVDGRIATPGSEVTRHSKARLQGEKLV